MQHHRVRRVLALLVVSLATLSCVDEPEADGATTQGPGPGNAMFGPDTGLADSAPPVPPSTSTAVPSSDAGANDSATLPTGTSSPSCRYSLWPEPDAAVVDYYCWPLAEATECMCNGALQRFEKRDPKQCMQSLAEFCQVDTRARTYCEHGQGGSGGCWPGEDEDQWLCECQLGGARQVVEGASCQQAGQTLCKQPATDCEDPTGRCRPSAEGQFTCECVFDTPARHELSATECSAALRTACATRVTPSGLQDECRTSTYGQYTSPAGFCSSKGRQSSDGYECQCWLPTLNQRQAKVMAASCQQALVYTCPEAVAGDVQ